LTEEMLSTTLILVREAEGRSGLPGEEQHEDGVGTHERLLAAVSSLDEILSRVPRRELSRAAREVR